MAPLCKTTLAHPSCSFSPPHRRRRQPSPPRRPSRHNSPPWRVPASSHPLHSSVPATVICFGRVQWAVVRPGVAVSSRIRPSASRAMDLAIPGRFPEPRATWRFLPQAEPRRRSGQPRLSCWLAACWPATQPTDSMLGIWQGNHTAKVQFFWVLFQSRCTKHYISTNWKSTVNICILNILFESPILLWLPRSLFFSVSLSNPASCTSVTFSYLESVEAVTFLWKMLYILGFGGIKKLSTWIK